MSELDTTRVEAGERGSTTVADRVFAKIAARAATEVEHTTSLAARLADRIPGRSIRPVDAQVLRSGRLVQVRVAVAVE